MPTEISRPPQSHALLFLYIFDEKGSKILLTDEKFTKNEGQCRKYASYIRRAKPQQPPDKDEFIGRWLLHDRTYFFFLARKGSEYFSNCLNSPKTF